MKSLVVTIFTFMILTKCLSQDHFVSYIDFNNTGQFAWQLKHYNNDFLLSIQTGCLDKDGSCGGILKLSDEAKVVNSFLPLNFSGNLRSILVKEDSILLVGEYEMGFAKGFSVHKLNSNFDILSDISLSVDDTTLYNYIALSASLLGDKLIVAGAAFCGQRCQSGILFVNQNKEVNEKQFTFVDPGYTQISECHINSYKELVLYMLYNDFNTLEDSIRIIRLDSSYNQTFVWSKEVKSNSIPRGCITSNNEMIITIPDGPIGRTQSIWSLDSIGRTNWIYQWPEPQGRTNILRIEEATNRDLFVMGQVLNISLLDDKRNVAFVLRLNSEGEKKWIRYFKIEDQDTRLSNYVSDLVELDNGDLQLTGQSRRIIFDGELGDFRPDQDIFWARIGGDGCINGDCSEVYTITSTNDILNESYDEIDIYPNPIQNNTLTLEVKNRNVHTALIYGLEGQLIKAVDMVYGVNTLTLETAASILLVRILDKNGHLIYSEKVIKI